MLKIKHYATSNSGLILYLLMILISSGLFISSLYLGGITWDEPDGPRMVGIHFEVAHGMQLPDPHVNNLVYYGIVNILPGYVLALFFDNYFVCSHITIFLMSLLTSYYVYKICLLIEIKRNVSFITSALLLLYPIWLGHSFFNYKDIPAGAFFTYYTYYVCSVVHTFNINGKISRFLYFKLIITGAVLIAVKFAFLPAILLNTLLIASQYKESIRLRIYFAVKSVILAIIVALLLTPGAWHQPLQYITNEISVMSKFDWGACSKLLNFCVSPKSDKWNPGTYLIFWYAAQAPLLFITLFILGIIVVVKDLCNKNIRYKIILLIILVQLLLFPLLAIVHNSVFYDATRHTVFCIPMIVIISGFGLQRIDRFKNRLLRMIFLILLTIFSSILLTDDFLLNPYQYSYYNEISRISVNDKNSETDYWGFSLREAYKTTNNNMYYSQYLNLEGPSPAVLLPYVSEIKFVRYDKNMQLPSNTSINLIGLVRDSEIDKRVNLQRCLLVAEISRKLLFKPDRLIMSKAYHCE
jgi:hypothetical protein